MPNMRQLLVSFALATAASLAAPTQQSLPTVQIRNGTLVGNSTAGIDSFFGIPYALPPVGGLRLRPPQAISHRLGTLKLPGTLDQVTACTQMNLTYFNLTAETSIPPDQQTGYYGPNGASFAGLQGEDCLTVNVQRPANTSPGQKLPVLFWMYGGAFEVGTTQDYDGTIIVNQSMAMEEAIIYVAVNYRVNGFGFLQGKELQADGATNLGLRDQRLALEWVAENIEAFGGDPDRVTIWGESAGAISVYDHMTINKGDNTYKGKPLFRAAIMNSGSILHTQRADSLKAQDVFDSVATYAGCSPTSFEDSNEILPCLRNVSFVDFRAAMNLLPDFGTSRSNDIAYIPRPDTTSDFFSQHGEVAAQNGEYARIPVIIGNMEDEASVFTPTQIDIVKDTASLVTWFNSWFTESPRELVQGLIDTYSTDPADGLPAHTGSKYQIYPQSKRNAAVQTDVVFGGRRIALSYLSQLVPTWSWLGTFQQGLPWWGTFHISDLRTQFGQDVNTYAGMKLDEAYIHFVNFLDPNGKPGKSDVWWPKWDNEGLKLANFSAKAVGITRDDFRWESYLYLKKYGSQLRQ